MSSQPCPLQRDECGAPASEGDASCRRSRVQNGVDLEFKSDCPDLSWSGQGWGNHCPDRIHAMNSQGPGGGARGTLNSSWHLDVGLAHAAAVRSLGVGPPSPLPALASSELVPETPHLSSWLMDGQEHGSGRHSFHGHAVWTSLHSTCVQCLLGPGGTRGLFSAVTHSLLDR